MQDLAKTLFRKIEKDIEICEEGVRYFPKDNRFSAGVKRSVQKIKDKLNSGVEIDASTLRHDIKNSLGAALGYTDLLKTKVKSDKEKTQATIINKSLKNILEETNFL